MAEEGYAIMQYRCEACGKIEKIYNARDGVTPFIVSCIYCGGNAQHINWHEDIYDPEYIPEPGQRIFFSMPIELARVFAKRNLKKDEQSAYPPPQAGTQERKELEEALVDDYYHDGEGPCIFTMPGGIPTRKDQRQ